jgi:hypothetical protein
MQAKDICLLASREAKGGTGMVNIAGQYLNLILEELKLIRNLKINRVTQVGIVQPGTYGPFTLEADYLRTYDMWYPLPTSGGGTASSMTQFLVPVTMEQFDAEFKSPSISNYPYEFATDLSTQAQADAAVIAGGPSKGLFYIYPQTSGQLTLTHRYMKDQPDILSPSLSTDTPWFPYANYLIKAVAGRMMGVTGDDRQDAYHAAAEEMLRPYLIQEGDEQQTVQSIRLDPRKFKFHQNLKPTKAAPY